VLATSSHRIRWTTLDTNAAMLSLPRLQQHQQTTSKPVQGRHLHENGLVLLHMNIAKHRAAHSAGRQHHGVASHGTGTETPMNTAFRA
jgi:hypothetical protein